MAHKFSFQSVRISRMVKTAAATVHVYNAIHLHVTLSTEHVLVELAGEAIFAKRVGFMNSYDILQVSSFLFNVPFQFYASLLIPIRLISLFQLNPCQTSPAFIMRNLSVLKHFIKKTYIILLM